MEKEKQTNPLTNMVKEEWKYLGSRKKNIPLLYFPIFNCKPD